jgi:hypothetical protein
MVALFSTSREKLPSTSVTVPFVVPTSTMLAPIMGTPETSVTVPVIFFFCCCDLSIILEMSPLRKVGGTI